MTENANQITSLLTELESMLTSRHGAQGGNLLEKVESIKGIIPEDLQGKLAGLLGQLGGAGGLASLFGLFGGESDKNEPASKPEVKPEHIDAMHGIMGELQSLLGNNTASTSQKTPESSQAATDPKEDHSASSEEGGLGGMIGSVLKSLTDQ